MVTTSCCPPENIGRAKRFGEFAAVQRSCLALFVPVGTLFALPPNVISNLASAMSGCQEVFACSPQFNWHVLMAMGAHKHVDILLYCAVRYVHFRPYVYSKCTAELLQVRRILCDADRDQRFPTHLGQCIAVRLPLRPSARPCSLKRCRLLLSWLTSNPSDDDTTSLS